MITTYIRDVAERAVKTAAQSAVVFLTVDQLNWIDIDWEQVAGASGLAALVSVLTSIASSGFGTRGTASLVQNVVDVEKAA